MHPSASAVPAALQRTAELQAGAISRRQALACGLTADMVRERVDSNRWQRLWRGVYATFSGPVPRLTRLWAALLVVGPGAVLSHATAAQLEGIIDDELGPVHVLVPADRRVHRRPGICPHYPAHVEARRHPARTPPRTCVEDTVLDLVDEARTEEAVIDVVVTRACQRRRTTSDRLATAAARRARLAHRTLVEELIADVAEGAETPLERRYFHSVERAHHLPRGERQVARRRGRRTQWRDVVYRPWRLVVELDGRAAHPDDEAHRDQARDNAATVEGDATLRYGWVGVVDPCGTAVQVACVLRARGWRGMPRPCGPGCTVGRLSEWTPQALGVAEELGAPWAARWFTGLPARLRAPRARSLQPTRVAGMATEAEPVRPRHPRVHLVREATPAAAPGVCCWRSTVTEAFSATGAVVEILAWPPAEPVVPGTTGSLPPDRNGVAPTAASDTPGSAALPSGSRPAHQPAPQPTRRWARRWLRRLAPLAARSALRRVRARRERGRPSPDPEHAESHGTAGGLVTAAPGGPPAPPPKVPTPPAPTAPAPARPPVPGLRDADLLLTETFQAAAQLVDAGAPPARVWVWFLPGQRPAMGEPTPWAEQLRSAADRIGGLVTDCGEARDAAERALAPGRLPTVALPPLVTDRTCSECADRELETVPPVASDNAADVVRNVALWRWLLHAARRNQAVSLPWSYVASRLLGPDAPWEPEPRPAWGPRPAAAEPRVPAPVEGWTAADAVAGAEAILATLAAGAGATPHPRPTRVLVSGFDLKFMRDLARRVGVAPDLDVSLDEWPAPGTRTDATDELAAGADVLVAEWVRPNAVWMSRTKRPGQRLVVRLHRFEIDSHYPPQVDIDTVDTVVYVAPHMGQRIVERLGWPADKLVYIPNFLDLDVVDRPKYDGARFTLGLVGVVPSRKRLDLALDVLVLVRRHDPRFTLVVRSSMPWTARYTWPDPGERRYWHRTLERLEKEPLLRGAVSFDPVGPDMGAWYRRVGHILSVSDDESFHLALCEGMASGAVPVLRPWPGTDVLYERRWVHGSPAAAAAAVLEDADAWTWQERAAAAREEVRRRYGPERVVAAWQDLLRGDAGTAARHFPIGVPAGS